MSVTAAPGFRAGAAAAGLKGPGELDVALVITEDGSPVPAAAVFTSNLAVAAPVQVSRAHLDRSGGQAAAVVLTAGNANAATGPAGVAGAVRLCEVVAGRIGVSPAEVLVCQTGLIGVPFPAELAAQALDPLAATLAGEGAPDGGRQAATAIMTTDTRPKEVAVRRPHFTVGGMAKGAAMLAPDMATMLAVLTTDAACPPDVLRPLLRRAVAGSFNSMTIDGCTSTNDTVVVLANGRAGPADPDELGGALEEACGELANLMVADAEGGTKVARIEVRGASSDGEAHDAARRVAGSLLVKCSLNGADPYWGRVVSELGSAGVTFDPDRVAVSYGKVTVCRDGVAAEHDQTAVAQHMAGERIDLICDLGLGRGTSVILTADLGYGYLDENRGDFVTSAATQRPAGDVAKLLIEVLPYMRRFQGATVVIKLGGSALPSPTGASTAAPDEATTGLAAFAEDLVLLHSVGIKPVVVHGGGPQIGDLLRRLGKESVFRDGRRVTDAETLDVARMVLVGKVNREIVAAVNVHGPLAVGLSGEDAQLLRASARHEELGFVGEVERVNPDIIERLLAQGLIPVVATIGADPLGQAYNINADTAAGALGAALQAEKLLLLTDVEGLRRDADDPGSLVHEVSVPQLEGLMADGSAQGGMMPKVEACLEAVRAGVRQAHLLDGRVPHALLVELFTDAGVGTMVRP